MNYFKIPIILIGLLTTVNQARPSTYIALENIEIANRVKQITVQIEGEEIGSGVIIENQGDTYKVLTNWHVVDTSGKYYIITPDGKKYDSNSDRVTHIPQIDLAVIEFTSPKNYSVAELGNSDELSSGSNIYLAGYAQPIFGMKSRNYLFASSQIDRRLQKPEQGYELVYQEYLTPASAGGPIVDLQGRLVGINSKYIAQSNGKRIDAWGIPLKTYLKAKDFLLSTALIPSPEDSLSEGNRFFKEEKFKEAVLEYNKVIKKEPTNIDVYYYRGEVYYATNNFNLALRDFQQIINRSPNNIEAYFYRANCFYYLKNYQSAIADYDRLLELSPERYYAYNNRGNAFYALKKLEKAKDDYSKAIAINPDYAEAYNNRANIYLHLKNYSEAIADYTQAIKILPNYAYAYNNRGLTYSYTNDLESAIADFDRAIQIEPKFAQAYYNRGNIYYSQQKYQQAINNYDRVIELEENPIYAYNNRGLSHYALKNYRQAIESFSKAITINSQDPDIFYNRALAYQDLGNKKKALTDFRQAAKLYQEKGNNDFYQGTLEKINQISR
jgi:tetratricopeptide (TPR) repeat protein